MRGFEFEDIHHALECKLIEIETLTHVVVGGDGLRVIIDHHRTIPLLCHCHQGIHATPVELHGGADTVGTRAEHHHRTMIAEVMDIVFSAVVSEIEVIGLSGIFSREGIDLLHHGADASLNTV